MKDGILEGSTILTVGGWLARVTISFPGKRPIVKERGPFATEDEARAEVADMARPFAHCGDVHFVAEQLPTIH